nr:ankyrin repeat domain containing protein [Mimivirus sp.]
MKYFTIVDNNYCLYNQEYLYGLNVYNSPQYIFYTIDIINQYYNFGTNLLIIEPDFDSKIRIISYGGDNYETPNIWKCSQIKVTKCLSLFDFDTYTQLGLDITENKYIVDFASEYGRIDFLQKWYNSSIMLIYGNKSLEKASGNNHIDILDWWLNSGYKLKYNTKAIKKHVGIIILMF